MSDPDGFYKAWHSDWKERNKKWRDINIDTANNLDDGGWTKHTAYRWSRPFGRDDYGYEQMLNYWPSTNKYMIAGVDGQSKAKTEASAFLKRVGLVKK